MGPKVVIKGTFAATYKVHLCPRSIATNHLYIKPHSFKLATSQAASGVKILRSVCLYTDTSVIARANTADRNILGAFAYSKPSSHTSTLLLLQLLQQLLELLVIVLVVILPP